MTAGLIAAGTLRAAPSKAALIDTNVWLSQWPIRRLALANTVALVRKLGEHGVERAWACSFDGILHKDIAGANARLVEECQRYSTFEPIGMVNPTLPGWQADVEACAGKHRMRALRLVPGYHGYKLDDSRFAELLALATAHGLAVQIALILEDERTQNFLLRVTPVDIAPLPQVLEKVPDARVMILNWTHAVAGKPVLLTLQKTNVLFDVAMLEGIMGIETALGDIPVERLCFGSYAPVFYFESAKLKLLESDLADAQLQAITHGNAQRFLGA